MASTFVGHPIGRRMTRLELPVGREFGYDDGDWAPLLRQVRSSANMGGRHRSPACRDRGGAWGAFAVVSKEDLGEPVRGQDLHLEVNYVVRGETHRMAVPEGRSVILGRTGRRPQPVSS